MDIVIRQTDPRLYDLEAGSTNKLWTKGTLLNVMTDGICGMITVLLDDRYQTRIFPMFDTDQTIATINSNGLHEIVYMHGSVIVGNWQDSSLDIFYHNLLIVEQPCTPSAFRLVLDDTIRLAVISSQAYVSVHAASDNYVVGSWIGSQLFVGNESLVAINNPRNTINGFVIAMDPDNSAIWARGLVSSKYAVANAVTTSTKELIVAGTFHTLIQQTESITKEGLSGFIAIYTHDGRSLGIKTIDNRPIAIIRADAGTYVLTQSKSQTQLTLYNDSPVWQIHIDGTLPLARTQLAIDQDSRVYVTVPYSHAVFTGGFKLAPTVEPACLLAIYDTCGHLILVNRFFGMTKLNLATINQNIFVSGSFENVHIINGSGREIYRASSHSVYALLMELIPYSQIIRLPRGSYCSLYQETITRANTLVLPEYLTWLGKRVRSIIMSRDSLITINISEICAYRNANILLH